MRRNRLLLLSLAALAAGCSTLRVSGYRPRKEPVNPSAALEPFALPTPEEQETAFGTRVSTGLRKKEEPLTERDLAALYYYDMGPQEIDVSGYPQKQQENYKVFKQACSACHTLARPINSPRSGYWAWEFYVFTMRLRSQFEPGTEFDKEQAERILDFLTYDSKIRKGRNRAAFEVLTKHLERRFDRMLSERMRKLQEGPVLRR